MPPRKPRPPKQVESIRHADASRPNLPSAEHQPLMRREERAPALTQFARRNRDLDPQLMWRGKDAQDDELAAPAPPLYIQERVQPKHIVDDLVRQTQAARAAANPDRQSQFIDLFADFNGLPSESAKTEFYRHDAYWSNRMILGDSLPVMASLAEREGLRGKVQCIYIDPPYGIRFNSNFQWSTTSRAVTDGNAAHITREPEQVKAFRDTWRDGIHSYLTYLRDRLTAARELLHESGSVFVQIGDENVHKVRAVMDEVFGDDNFVSEIVFTKTRSLVASNFLTTICDYILWYAKDINAAKGKMRKVFMPRQDNSLASHYENSDGEVLTVSQYRAKQNDGETTQDYRPFKSDDLIRRPNPEVQLEWQGRKISGRFRTSKAGLVNLLKANRIHFAPSNIRYKFFLDDFNVSPLNHLWQDVMGAQDQTYVVQTNDRVIQRCVLMTTDPGDLVLDPTCGSGTTAYIAEQWGRRWITIDTSRVALALARARLMGARYPYYLLADSAEGKVKDAELSRRDIVETPSRGDVRQGFVYKRVPHIALRDIANNAEIDTIYETHQQTLEPLRERLNAALGVDWQEWQIPREPADDWGDEAVETHKAWQDGRIARQREIDASIAAKAKYEYLYDQPYEDNRRVRVAGPFTVESLSPHRAVLMDDDSPNGISEKPDGYASEYDFADIILEDLRAEGIQQAHKEDRIKFTSLVHWPGRMVCADGAVAGEGDNPDRRAAIFIGPEFGTVSRPDLVEAAREAAESGFDMLIACAFSYEAQVADIDRLGRIPVLKARMNADLHMATDLKSGGGGNLFVIFGEPDIELRDAPDDHIQVEIKGVDVFHPNTGEIRSDGPEGIACWFIDTDYNQESFFVRHAYFPGASKDPYKALKTSLKAEIDADAWATLQRAVSRPFPRPASGRIAVKVINRLGDEVMKVYRV